MIMVFLALVAASADGVRAESLLRPEAAAAVFKLSLKEAEKQALTTSNFLRAYASDQDAADSQATAQFQNLLPRLSLQGTYQYYAEIPQVKFLPGMAIPFGTNSTYFFGPALNYTLWDTFSGRKAYQSASLLTQARQEDRKNAELQLIASVRMTYVEVQLGLQELLLIQDSLKLAQAQNADVETRFHAGAATRLDTLGAKRSVLSAQIKFKQRQAQLASALKDLFTLLGDHTQRNLSRPGPVGVPATSIAFKFETLEQLISEQTQGLGPNGIAPPDETQPQIRSLKLQQDALHLVADSQKAKMLPTVQVSAGVSYNLPNMPNPPSYWQETIGVTASVPLFLGDPTPHLAAQSRSQADAAGYRTEQLRDTLQRDFAKAQELLQNLDDQKKLAVLDVDQSEEESKLYYTSYKAGKLNFIDVQNANNQALLAKVSAARIDSQILNQVIVLKSLSGREMK